jgi:hypothetical protein
MNPEELKQAREKLRQAKYFFKQRRYQDAMNLLEQISELDADFGPEEIAESASELISRIKRERGLKLSRWMLISTVLVTSIVVGLLAVIPLESTPVEMKLYVNRIDFHALKRVSLEPMKISGVDILGQVELKSNLEVKTIPNTKVKPDNKTNQRKLPDFQGAVFLRQNTTSSRLVLQSRYLRLSDLSVPENTQVILDSSEYSEDSLKINTLREQSRGSFDIDAKFSVDCKDCMFVDFNGTQTTGNQKKIGLQSTNKVIYFSAKSKHEPLQINLKIDGKEGRDSSLLLARNIKIYKLELNRPKRGKPSVSSIVQPSQINFLDFDNRKFFIQPGDFLSLTENSELHIKSVLFNGLLVIEAIGNVKGIQKITNVYRRDMMPSLLEWLVENYTLNLFLAALLPILSIVLAAIYRLKIIDEG